MADNDRTGVEELRRRQATRESHSNRNRRPVGNSVRRKEKRGAIGCLVLVVVLFAVGILVYKGDFISQGVQKSIQREYTPFDLVEMADVADQNPLRAEALYNNQYGEVHGYLDVIGESDGKVAFIISSQKRDTISTGQTWNPFDESEIGKPGGMLTCAVMDDRLRESLLSLSIGDAVTVRGKVVYSQGLYVMEVDSVFLTGSVEQNDVQAVPEEQNDVQAMPEEPPVDWDNSEQLFVGRGGRK